MVSALDSGSSVPGSSRGHCVVFLGKTLNASLHPGVLINGYRQNLMLGVTLRWMGE